MVPQTNMLHWRQTFRSGAAAPVSTASAEMLKEDRINLNQICATADSGACRTNNLRKYKCTTRLGTAEAYAWLGHSSLHGKWDSLGSSDSLLLWGHVSSKVSGMHWSWLHSDLGSGWLCAHSGWGGVEGRSHSGMTEGNSKTRTSRDSQKSCSCQATVAGLSINGGVARHGAKRGALQPMWNKRRKSKLNTIR